MRSVWRAACIAAVAPACFLTFPLTFSGSGRGGECRETNDCRSGLFCWAGHCSVRCSAGGNECGEGALCGEAGYCIERLLSAAECDPPCGEGKTCDRGACVCRAPACTGCCIDNECLESSPTTCGSDAQLCVACSGLTPACKAGQCVADCDASACGTGCCTATGCQPGLADAACGLEGACLDCARAASGGKCLNGQCRCLSERDCPPARSCPTSGEICQTTCGPDVVCNGGCCDGGTCRGGNNSLACGGDGKACISCAGDPAGPKCVAGRCGCESETDCPVGQACLNGACGTGCNTSAPCRGGCCLNGTCAAGAATTACGATGSACLDCTTHALGHLCKSGGCGCTTESQCNAGLACDGAHCTTGCAPPGQKCNGGCCSSGSCASGTQAASCGVGGGLCTDCSSNTDGTACRSGGVCGCNAPADCTTNGNGTGCLASGPRTGKCGCPVLGAAAAACASSPLGKRCLTGNVCGCNSETDCGSYQACNGNVCTTACDATHPCNGGCCSNGTCIAGTAPAACGGTGGACVDCAATVEGSVCDGNKTCGCAADGECASNPRGADCLPTGKCGCDAPADCVGNSRGTSCVLGQCGCTLVSHCTSPLMACMNNVCGSACGSTSTSCSTGCCGSTGSCVPGNTDVDCISGTKFCVGCAGNPNGHTCRQLPAPGCGCSVTTDCPPFKACNPLSVCTTSCDPLTRCNGGCCNGGTCAPGLMPAACGGDGFACKSCASDPDGIACLAGGTCGCNLAPDCAASPKGAACRPNQKCGCTVSAECAPLFACRIMSQTCAMSCNAPGEPCREGCCQQPIAGIDGTCQAGLSPSACGENGMTCQDCGPLLCVDVGPPTGGTCQ